MFPAKGGLAAAVVLVVALVAAALPGAARPGAGPSIDIELAFDTTGSMRLALAGARQDAEEIFAGVRAVVPGARFSVVAFRDRGNPGGEYQTLQPLTTDSAAVQRALAELKAVHNTSPDNLNVESYNLAFHRSFTESGLKWAQNSRKIVIVMGDAEGYGGGKAGVPGCLDAHSDPDGLEMRAQLAGMRAAQRTLVMVREVSAATTVSLQCYASMAALTYTGGAARDGNSSDLVTPLLGLLHGAVAPIAISPNLPAALPRGGTTLTVTVSNPNAFALQANDLALTLPSDFTDVSALPAATTSSGTKLTWTLGRTLAPHAKLVVRVSAKVGAKTKVAQIGAAGHFQITGAGEPFTSDASAQIHVTRTTKVELNSLTRRGSIRGRATISLATARSLTATSGKQIAGTFRLLNTKGRTVTLRPFAYHLALARGHALARMAVRVTSVGRTAGCHVGTKGTLTVTDHSYGSASGKATIALALPAACRPAGASWPAPGGAIHPFP